MATGADSPNAAFAHRDLSGAHALVTGGSRGIGEEIVRALVAQHAKVISLSRSTPSGSHAVDGVDYRVCDLGKPTEIAATFAGIEKDFGYLDILIVNAAIMPGACMPSNPRMCLKKLAWCL